METHKEKPNDFTYNYRSVKGETLMERSDINRNAFRRHAAEGQ